MCKLIASEELWLLLDALQEPVPEEVDQHLENINSSTIPLLVCHVCVCVCVCVMCVSCVCVCV